MTKEFFWSGTSGDKITVIYSGTPTSGSEVSIMSDINKTVNSRSKTLNVHVESDTSIGVPLVVNLNSPVECYAMLYGLDVPVSCTYLNYTVTNEGISVNISIPAEDPYGTTITVTRLTMVTDGNYWYVAASTYASGTFYMINGGLSGYYMVSDINRAEKITNFTCSWTAGSRVYNRRKSTSISDGTYILNDSLTQLVFESAPSTGNLYRDLSAGKLYQYNGTTLVEITN